MSERAFAVLGLFDSAQALIDAVPTVKAKRLGRLETYTPYPVHGMDEALELRRSPLAGMVLVAGFVGAAMALFFQWWMSAVDYPIPTGGKALFSWQAFVPIMFEMTVLFATFTAVGFGMALPYVVLAISPGAVKVLPKPGPWMDRFRAFMGFLLAAAAVWLLYVLSSQVSRERLAFIELALLLVALFLWMRSKSPKGSLWAATAIVGLLLSTGGALVLSATSEVPNTVDSDETFYLIDWVQFDRQEAESLAAEGRMVFVDVTADWCFTCKVNERLVLETAEIAELFNSFEVIPMKADWTNRDEAIADFLAEHGKYGIPFYLLYRPGQEPHLFSELLTKEAVVAAVSSAGTGT